MKKQNIINILHTSFLGAIGKDVRAISFDYTDDTIIIYAYLDREPTTEDYNIIDIAVTEVMASSPNFIYQKINMENTIEPIGKLKVYAGWIFVRYEEN